MFSQYFGEYLMTNNQITYKQFDSCMKYMDTHRVKLGLIAVSEGLLSQKQADEINLLQTQQDKRFGDLAVEKGYLTEADVLHLLRMQGNPYLIFIQALEENNIMVKEDAEVLLNSFQKEYHFTNTQMQALKSGNIDEIIPIFIADLDERYTDFISLAIRNVIRFVSTKIRFEEISKVSTYHAKHIALQRTEGDFNGMLAFASDNHSLTLLANGYAKENYNEVNEDVMDASCEFINCINGLFASKLAEQNVNIDMLPPENYTDHTITGEPGFYVLPLYICGEQVDLLVSIDNTLTIEN